jgi:hypothetical protein
MSDDSRLPETPAALYDLATDETVDPYRREAAIKRLGELAAGSELADLADGAALSVPERTLAEARRDAIEPD